MLSPTYDHAIDASDSIALTEWPSAPATAPGIAGRTVDAFNRGRAERAKGVRRQLGLSTFDLPDEWPDSGASVENSRKGKIRGRRRPELIIDGVVNLRCTGCGWQEERMFYLNKGKAGNYLRDSRCKKCLSGRKRRQSIKRRK